MAQLPMYPGQANSPITELVNAIDDVQDMIEVSDGLALPDAPNIAVIGTGEEAETIQYGTKTGNVLSDVVRGFQGTAKAWPAGNKVARYFTAYDYDALRQNLIAHLDEITQKATEIVSVGIGGDFSNINDALEFLSKRHARFFPQGYSAEIKLLSGFVMEEQVLVTGVDLGWITITSEDSVVLIDKAYITKYFGIASHKPTFGAAFNARLPIIGALFDMQITGHEAGLCGIGAYDSSQAVILPNCGVKNVGDTGLYANKNSIIDAMSTNFSNAGHTGAQASRQSFMNIAEGDFSNARVHCVHAYQNSIVNARNVTATGADEGNGLRSNEGSFLLGYLANARKGSTDDPNDINVLQGSIISALASIGGTSQTPNEITNQGIIFR